MSDASPFDTFLALSRQYNKGTKGLPGKADVVSTRLMICFSLMGVNLAVALEEVVELLELPDTTTLPGVKPWVRGIANLHGRLLPVVSAAEFFGGHAHTLPQHQRVMVLDMHDIYVGLAVDQIYGMRHLQLDNYCQEVVDVPEVLLPYIDGGFVYEEESWLLFQPAVLVQDHSFLDVAA